MSQRFDIPMYLVLACLLGMCWWSGWAWQFRLYAMASAVVYVFGYAMHLSGAKIHSITQVRREDME